MEEINNTYLFDDPLIIAGRKFKSRLLIGTGKFPSAEALQKTIKASGTEIVTVALRRVDLKKPENDSILSVLNPKEILILPNTSGARTAEEALKLARIARSAGLEPWVKLELTPEPRYLLPDPIETLKAAELLIKDGFTVLPYIQADPILAKKLEELGTATVMPLGSPIGSNKGLKTKELIKIIIEQSNVPVVVDAGLGAPSHSAEAMEMGADAVLVNTALADAQDHEKMATAFRLATEAGRLAFRAGLGPQRDTAEASSPLTGFLFNSKNKS
ncbi:MAG TPA: thiazole synthase [Candidatus Hydrogenedens sp.]|nr:thiazole synthase [Candidatus Hydrogenedens sp.]HOK09900.1 thiazole synthase [Candidatus Hydrogenedens sp.]HOL19785.1 thiazole synthase [Candidatus Hydrogenedens sp.]HPP59524.1 thiazole synthase [Candidatus Hydrogenedens sp.]